MIHAVRYCMLFLFLASAQALAETQELFAGYSLFSQATLRNPEAVHLLLGWVDPMTEAFGLRFEYGYARVNDQKNDWHEVDRQGLPLRERNRVKLSSHSFMIGAQQDLGHSMIAWSGVTAANMRGRYILEGLTHDDQHFGFDAVFGFIQSGFGHRWQLNEKSSFGVDWLVFSVYFYRQLDVQNSAELRRLKGPFHSFTSDIKQTMDQIHAIRSLGLRIGFSF
jgi:hypothetical protein